MDDSVKLAKTDLFNDPCDHNKRLQKCYTLAPPLTNTSIERTPLHIGQIFSSQLQYDKGRHLSTTDNNAGLTSVHYMDIQLYLIFTSPIRPGTEARLAILAPF